MQFTTLVAALAATTGAVALVIPSVGTTTSDATILTKRANAGEADFQTCDITSLEGENIGKVTLLFNVDIGLPFQAGEGCNYIKSKITDVGSWSCTDNGSGGTSLKFTTDQKGTVEGVRDTAVSDVLGAYGGAITSNTEGGVANHGFCKLTYPEKR